VIAIVQIVHPNTSRISKATPHVREVLLF